MRNLHANLRAGDLRRSIDIHIQVPGTRRLRRNDYPAGCFVHAFVEDPDGCKIELVRRKAG